MKNISNKVNIPKGGTSLDGPSDKVRNASLDRPVAKATEKTKKVEKEAVKKPIAQVTNKVKDVTKKVTNAVTGKKEDDIVRETMEAVGKFGTTILGTQRMPVAIINMIVGCFALCFYCVALAGCSTDNEGHAFI